ncbi:uncharacterized protein LOC127836841 [Dreissena polymorpha]|uniref:uncharacterized protein LOC127836841 n=1 Tax=Dreissena polymorpha TaxID=45954 RepID=UPI00226464BE|nr:uncharacterized protein LOC127836841 [Dreissena polymorpha]
MTALQVYCVSVFIVGSVHIVDSCTPGEYDQCPAWSSCSKGCGGGRQCRTCQLCLWSIETKKFCRNCNEFCYNGNSFVNGRCLCPSWRAGECCEVCRHINIPNCVSGQQQCGGSPDGIMCSQCESGYYSGGYNRGCLGTLGIPVTSLSNTLTKGQTMVTTHTLRETIPKTTQTLSLETATPPKNIQSTASSSTTASHSDSSNQEAPQRGSTTTVIAVGVSVAVVLAVAAVVLAFVLRKKQVLPCSKTTSSSYTGKHSVENGPEQHYEDLVDRDGHNTIYSAQDISIDCADGKARYHNTERDKCIESETNDKCNSDYYNNRVDLEHVEQNYMN